jgi:hypothetical protein
MVEMLFNAVINSDVKLKDETEWNFCDVLKLPKQDQVPWIGKGGTCKQEMNALHTKGVLGPLIVTPPGADIIDCHWVFKLRSDGRHKG